MFRGHIMRIAPLINKQIQNCYNPNKKTQTQFVRKDINTNLPNYRYSGNASKDLAYASLIDPSIAYDLKRMGLI